MGCGGRCGLFVSDAEGLFHLEGHTPLLTVGERVDVEVSAPRLRHAASRAYGIAIAALVAGALLGHVIGARWSVANAGTLVGLLLGTFLAGALTKRSDTPPLRVRPLSDTRFDSDTESKEHSR